MVEAAGRVGAANRLPGTLDITSPKSGTRRQATFTTPYATLPSPSSPGRSFAGDIAPEEDEVRPGERGGDVERADPERTRSEEHTSELQSRLHLVCRLLLEKKKKTHNTRETTSHTHESQQNQTHN